MIHAYDGSEKGIATFTERGVESLKEFRRDPRLGWRSGNSSSTSNANGGRGEIISPAAFPGWIPLKSLFGGLLNLFGLGRILLKQEPWSGTGLL
ncbi:hypothetical protein IE4803_PB00473 (plasmid) [Rhizobium etli bv. phaseoli str. IE4803]|nr:hypothetical protein IE4803_PB00473 [Rhizobium etli bv. phaseoli str. IE4803]